MLTELDRQEIATGGYMVDHCHELMSLALGEPCLEHGILYYWDGKMITINGYGLGLSPGQAAEGICKVVDAWKDHPSLQAVACFGPQVPDLLDVLGEKFELLDRAEADPNIVDMTVDLTETLPKFGRRDARLAKRRGIDVSVRQRTLLTGEHLEIIGDFLRHHEVEPLTRTLFSNINAYLRDPNTYILEAVQDGELKGFATLSLTLQELPLLTLAFYRKGAQYASDGVMNAAREYCIQQGYQRLGLGISGGESSYRYKVKWGAAPSSEPYASVFYLRKESDFPVDVIGWGSRIVQHGRM